MLWRKDERWVWMKIRGVLYGIIAQHQGWVRLWGWGISWHSTLIPSSFSGRMGYCRVLRVGPWSFRWLRRRAMEGE